ncbi:MAG: hypothetical protein ACFB02_07710 [Mastigocoleus sp.]
MSTFSCEEVPFYRIVSPNIFRDNLFDEDKQTDEDLKLALAYN